MKNGKYLLIGVFIVLMIAIPASFKADNIPPPIHQ